MECGKARTDTHARPIPILYLSYAPSRSEPRLVVGATLFRGLDFDLRLLDLNFGHRHLVG